MKNSYEKTYSTNEPHLNESKHVSQKDSRGNFQKGDLGTFQKHDSSYIGSGQMSLRNRRRKKKRSLARSHLFCYQISLFPPTRCSFITSVVFQYWVDRWTCLIQSLILIPSPKNETLSCLGTKCALRMQN